jgi:hypothetical protein
LQPRSRHQPGQPGTHDQNVNHCLSKDGRRRTEDGNSFSVFRPSSLIEGRWAQKQSG